MKTLQIGMDWFPEKGVGGLDRYYYELTHFLPSIDVEAIGLVTGSAQVSERSEGHIHAFSPPEKPIFSRLSALRTVTNRLLREDNYSLFASHFVLYTFPILKQLRQRPLVVHFHGPWSIESVVEGGGWADIWLRKLMEQTVFRRAATFIVLSKAFQDILQQNYQISPERIHIVPGGVDIQRFSFTLSKNDLRKELGWPQDRFVLFTARRLSKRMGLENLISAFHTIQNRYSDVLLLIAGKGDLKATLQSQIKELGLSNHVRLLGYLTEQQLNIAYRAADLTIIPTSKLEGFGLIILESLAAGTPVIGTPVGGIPEVLRPFCNDLVFEGFSAKHLSDGILDVLSGDRRLPNSQECISHIEQNYTWSIISQRIKSIYQMTIDNY